MSVFFIKLLNNILCGPLMPNFSLDNTFYEPIVLKLSLNKILHGPLMFKFSLGNRNPLCQFSLLKTILHVPSFPVYNLYLCIIRTHQGVHLRFKANSPVGYWDYQIQSPTIISTSPQNCPIFEFIITYIIIYIIGLYSVFR